MTPLTAIAIFIGAAFAALVRSISFLLRSHNPHPVQQPAPCAAWPAERGWIA